MSRTIMLIPIDTNFSLNIISLGITHSIRQKGINLRVFRPIEQPKYHENNLKTDDSVVMNTKFNVLPNKPLTMNYVESLISSNQQDILMEKIISQYHNNIQEAKVIIVEGLLLTQKHHFVNKLNCEIAKILSAEIIFIISLSDDSPSKLKKRINLIRYIFGDKNRSITGIVINKLNIPVDEQGKIRPFLLEPFDNYNKNNVINTDLNFLFKNSPLPILGYIPWSIDLISTRVIDIIQYLGASIIHEGEVKTRYIKFVIFCTYSIQNMIKYFRPDSLIVTSADRHDVLIGACLAVISGIKISAILLTGGYDININIYHLCKRAFNTGLPVFIVKSNTWQTLFSLQSFNLEISYNDSVQIEKLRNYVASHINNNWIESFIINSKYPRRLSPLLFRYQLVEMARQANKRIVLPEGNEPRTIKAASICNERGIAHCILLGNPDEIQHVASKQGIKLSNNIEIIDPKLLREKYIMRLVELRKNKGMTETLAREQLKDNVVLGTLMLEQNEVHGMVSGAIHTTANTIRPSLQLIKTAPGSSLISSVFFMLLPDQVLVYGDCAINPNPNSIQLAEIAIQSANSAITFGIEPRVAMISYSTGTSSTGSEVEKVREATRLVQKKRPDLIIDGPLQYDAAIVADVAMLKAPNSPLAGQATVFIFPDLNTGNTTYKAVQRTAGLISIGPMLQGMRKPVNDLSRGALIDDIVYTIALTAIQAEQIKN